MSTYASVATSSSNTTGTITQTANSTPTVFEDLWTFNFAAENLIQHKIKLVKVNGLEFIAFSKYYFNPDTQSYLPTKKHYFIPQVRWAELQKGLVQLNNFINGSNNGPAANGYGVLGDLGRTNNPSEHSRPVGAGSTSITTAVATANPGSIRPNATNSIVFPKARFVPIILGQRTTATPVGSIAAGGFPDLFDNDDLRPPTNPLGGVIKRGRGRPPKDSTLAKKSKPSDESALNAVFKPTEVSKARCSAGAAAGEESDEDEKESVATTGNSGAAVDNSTE